MAAYEVSPDQLRWKCALSLIPFECTSDMIPLADFIGQERAMRAIEFGLGVNKPGFNIYVNGLTGTGKTTIIKSFLKKITAEMVHPDEDSSVPEDWCYVYNFADPDRPQALNVRRGWGKILKRDMEEFVQSLQKEIQATFESEEYARQRQTMVEDMQKRHQAMMEGVIEEGRKGGFALKFSPAGMMMIPLRKDGKPMPEDEYLTLPVDEKKVLEVKQNEIGKRVDQVQREGKKLEREIAERLAALDRQAGEYVVRIPLSELQDKYRDYPKVIKYLDGVKNDILGNLGKFKGTEASERKGPLLPIQPPENPSDPFLPYRVNVFVDNSDTQGPPIIIETNPTYHNVFGVVEKRQVLGGFTTDFTQIKAGSINRANAGYLVLYDRDVLSNPGVWESLKRVIKNQEHRIEEPASQLGWIPPQGLRPEPIPTDTKIIMIGDPHLYQYLSASDSDFRETFKVKADFDYEIDKSNNNIVSYACFISGCCQKEGLRHFDASGVSAIVEHGARLVEDQEKLSIRFSDILDVLVESDYWAKKDDSDLVKGKHVEKALEEKTFRLNLVEEKLQEMIAEGTILVDVQGAVSGQLNGLAIYQMGGFSFGKPSRITCKTFLGRGGIINIERGQAKWEDS